MKYFIYIISIVLFLQGCTEKDLTEPEIKDPIFKINATIDGSEFRISAGLDNYFVEPSFDVDVNNVINFKCKFLNHSSLDQSKGLLEIILKDDAFFGNGEHLPVIGDYAFYSYDDSVNLSPKIVYHGIVKNGIPPYSYKWTFLNNTLNGNPEFEIDKDTVSKFPGNYVRLDVYDKLNNHSFYIRNAENLTNQLSTDFQFHLVNNYLIFNDSVQGGFPPYIINKYVGINDSLIMGDLSFNIAAAKQIIRADVTDNSGQFVSSKKTFFEIDKEKMFECRFTSEEIPGSKNYNFSKAEIKFTAPDGEIFTTKYKKNMPPLNLEVIEINEYKNDSTGNKTIKIKIEFDCLLYSQAGKVKTFRGNGEIVVSHP